MRPKAVLLAALPFTNALSLGNFQDITSVLVPIKCLLTYDQQISDCVVADFGDNGCSTACQASLTSLASSVNQACASITVNSNTLLGIIKGGGILPALCTSLQKSTTTTSRARTTTAAPAPVQQPTEASITLPTASPGVQVSSTTSSRRATSTAQPVASTFTTQPVASTPTTAIRSSSSKSSNTIESATETSTGSTVVSSAVSTPEPTPVTIAPITSSDLVTSTSQRTSSTTSKSSSATQKPSSGENGGGGSPFDTQSSTASSARTLGSSILVVMVALGASMLVGR